MQYPAKGRGCKHLQCFDLPGFHRAIKAAKDALTLARGTRQPRDVISKCKANVARAWKCWVCGMPLKPGKNNFGRSASWNNLPIDILLLPGYTYP